MRRGRPPGCGSLSELPISCFTGQTDLHVASRQLLVHASRRQRSRHRAGRGARRRASLGHRRCRSGPGAAICHQGRDAGEVTDLPAPRERAGAAAGPHSSLRALPGNTGSSHPWGLRHLSATLGNCMGGSRTWLTQEKLCSAGMLRTLPPPSWPAPQAREELGAGNVMDPSKPGFGLMM